MPYIIETRTPEKIDYDMERAQYLTTRTAVATLEEARQRVFEATERYGCIVAVDAARSIREVGHPDPNRAGDVSGGTVGPLPDGTVIEVAPITWTWLTSQTTTPNVRGQAAILAAFNAA